MYIDCGHIRKVPEVGVFGPSFYLGGVGDNSTLVFGEGSQASIL